MSYCRVFECVVDRSGLTKQFVGLIVDEARRRAEVSIPLFVFPFVSHVLSYLLLTFRSIFSSSSIEPKSINSAYSEPPGPKRPPRLLPPPLANRPATTPPTTSLDPSTHVPRSTIHPKSVHPSLLAPSASSWLVDSVASAWYVSRPSNPDYSWSLVRTK